VLSSSSPSDGAIGSFLIMFAAFFVAVNPVPQPPRPEARACRPPLLVVPSSRSARSQAFGFGRSGVIETRPGPKPFEEPRHKVAKMMCCPPVQKNNRPGCSQQEG
jgi:hypothetical protein